MAREIKQKTWDYEDFSDIVPRLARFPFPNYRHKRLKEIKVTASVNQVFRDSASTSYKIKADADYSFEDGKTKPISEYNDLDFRQHYHEDGRFDENMVVKEFLNDLGRNITDSNSDLCAKLNHESLRIPILEPEDRRKPL